MEFSEALRDESRMTTTENGAVALNTTSDARLDLFSIVGALRSAEADRVEALFEASMRQDPLFTMKILFYARDVREGLGERDTFRTMLRYAAEHYPKYVTNNISLIGFFGRYDDLYCLIGTRVEDAMWSEMKRVFLADKESMEQGKPISLLAKWIKSADASSKKTRALGIETAHRLGYDVYHFKREVKKMRKYLGVTEGLMSTNRWGEILYEEVPGRAMKLYKNAFERHDGYRFSEFIDNVEAGKEKINSSTLYPYDLVREVSKRGYSKVIEEQWKALPNYVEPGSNVLIMADTSDSMTWSGGAPIYTAVGLAIYFAERNAGAYHNLFMTFSTNPSVISLKEGTLNQKVKQVMRAEWGGYTNLEKAFIKVLDIAIDNNTKPEEMPKAIVVISDMEIGCCTYSDWTFYDGMRKMFWEHGYVIPNVIFWNVNSRHDVFHADKNKKGVQLVSGQSTSTFKHVVDNLEYNPLEAMEETINSERYDCVKGE